MQASNTKLAEAATASKQAEVGSRSMRAPRLCTTTELASCVVQEAMRKLQNEHDEATGKLKTTEALEMKIKDLETSLAKGSVCCPPVRVACISASHRARVSLQRRQKTLRRQMRRQQRMRSMWQL